MGLSSRSGGHLGDAPRTTFGNAESRPALAPTCSPGPAYNLREGGLPGSFTRQCEAKLATNPRAVVGTEQRTTPMAPGYTHALYNVSTSMVKGTNFGTSERFRNSCNTQNDPGPDAYNI